MENDEMLATGIAERLYWRQDRFLAIFLNFFPITCNKPTFSRHLLYRTGFPELIFRTIFPPAALQAWEEHRWNIP